MDEFKSAKWIWSRDTGKKDCYSEFLVVKEFHKNDDVKLRISSDSNYAVYVNGVFVNSGQYADMPHYKVYDEVDLGNYIIPGTNYIAFVVWYYGVPSFTYYIGKQGVIFEIEENGEVVVSSDEDILSRKSRRYISGRREMITPQLGLNYHVDLKESDDWTIGKDMDGFATSIVQDNMPTNLVDRISKKLNVLPMVSGDIVMQGAFTYPTDECLTQHAGDRMQNAALSFFRLAEMADDEEKPMTMIRKSGEGIFFIVDIQKENAGYLEFDLEVPENCLMEVGWGEHLLDGRCRSAVGQRNKQGTSVRNFSVTVQLKQGRNHYMNPFRRLGCRYIQLFIHTQQVKVHDVGLRPTLYPVTPKVYKSGNLLRDEIYAVCQNTLLQCMHEHYEDCPWREQAFYSLDSRNQMLCGYYAFEEYEFPRAGLRLIAHSIREDGLLPICYPTNERLTIPSFALSYIMQVAEYYQHTGDKETVAYCFDTAKKVIDTCVNRIDETGLIPNFPESEGYWNFYEWQPYLNGRSNYEQVYDMCLNAFLSLMLGYFEELCNVMGEDAKPYNLIKKSLNEKIVQEFFDRKAELFIICKGYEDRGYSVLANALGCLCGAADCLNKDKMLKIILDNGTEETLSVIPATLSMHTFRYDALLREDAEHYKEAILSEIDRVYFRMLQSGATSFWETEKGDRDFEFAGSLCHGWAAMPIVYYETLCMNKGTE